MTVAHLASHESQVQVGYLVAMFGIPAIGLVCLIIGLLERSRSRRQSSPYPPQYPPGFTVNPGYPYPPPPPPGYPPQPYPGYGPEYPRHPRTAKSATTLITIGAVLLTLGGLGILGNVSRVLSEHGRASPTTGQSSPSTAGAEIGQCFTEFELGMGSLNQPTDCAASVATYELAAKGGPTTTCPDGKRDDSVYSRLTNESHTLCFAANLQQGQCYLRTEERKTATWTPIDCTEARFARFKVDKRVDGSTDKTQCPRGTRANAYPQPPRLYCVANVGS